MLELPHYLVNRLELNRMIEQRGRVNSGLYGMWDMSLSRLSLE